MHPYVHYNTIHNSQDVAVTVFLTAHPLVLLFEEPKNEQLNVKYFLNDIQTWLTYSDLQIWQDGETGGLLFTCLCW